MPNSPRLRTELNIDPAAAQQNALATQYMRTRNAMATRKVRDYDADRKMALEDRQYEIDRRPAKDA